MDGIQSLERAVGQLATSPSVAPVVPSTEQTTTVAWPFPPNALTAQPPKPDARPPLMPIQPRGLPSDGVDSFDLPKPSGDFAAGEGIQSAVTSHHSTFKAHDSRDSSGHLTVTTPASREISTRSSEGVRKDTKRFSEATRGVLSEISKKKEQKKKKSKKVRPTEFLFRRRLEDAISELTNLQKWTRGRAFSLTSGIAIFLNCVFIGWTTQWLAHRANDSISRNEPPTESEPQVVFVLQVVFCFFFFWELLLRWLAEGCIDFFRSPDMWWNILDVLIVGFGVVDILADILVRMNVMGSDTSKMLDTVSVLRGLRVMRVIKMARVIRVMKYFRELRIIIFSILGSLKSLTWVVLSINLVFYIFGIIFTSAVVGYWETQDNFMSAENQILLKHFSTLDKSMLSLYMSMAGGNDWALYYEALEPLPPMYQLLFLLFITISVFAVVNIVTGVFVEHAMQSSAHDREVVVNEELQMKRRYLACMQEVFEEMDIDDSGCISSDEFEARLNDERVIAYCSAMKLDVSDARALFRLMDYDQSGEVSIDEFLDACFRLQGESRRIDIKMMQHEIRYLDESFRSFREALDQAWGGSLRKLQQENTEKECATIRRLLSAEEKKAPKEQERHNASTASPEEDTSFFGVITSSLAAYDS
jgi:hypothetical protein